MISDASKALFFQQIDDISEQIGVTRYEAFPRWICQNILGITGEGQIDEAVSIGGKDDYGLDIFHADKGGDITEEYICLVQTKFSEKLNHMVNREEMESFVGTLSHLKDCPFNANKTFKQKSAEFIKMETEHPHIQKKLIFAVTGGINDQVKEMINNDRWKKERLRCGSDSNVRLEILDLNDILSCMTVQSTPTLCIQFDGNVIERLDKTTDKKSIIGYVSASSLIKLAKEYKDTLFLENPRQIIGHTAPTHKAILNTLSNNNMRKKFWKLNNGITAICTYLHATDDPAIYSIDNFKIVNGRQTTYTLEDTIHPIDDVFLSMIIHEAVDDSERNQISEATNTQNPIKPVDLVTNYPEMTNLVLQCKKDFCEFYFERQTHGFRSAKKSTQQRVTNRRIMEKNSTARSYYAYAISPVDATMPDKVLFSVTHEPNYYELIFKNQNMQDLIIPHIFMQTLIELHRKWCNELKDNPTDEIARNKGIISKDVVKYYILKFIYESMMSIDESTRNKVKEKMITRFRNLKQGDAIPSIFLDVASTAYATFMLCFDMDRKETWPPEMIKKISNDTYQEQKQDVPSPYDMTLMLQKNGDQLMPHLLRMRKHMLTLGNDEIKAKILEI